MSVLDLTPLVDSLEEIRQTTRRMLAPCGFGCDCVRVEHIDQVLVAKGLQLGDPTGLEAVQMSLRLANETYRALPEIASQPGVAEAVDTMRLRLMSTALLVDYLMTKEVVLRDLPDFTARQGSPRASGGFIANAGTFVYVAYDVQGDVIYVGMTDDLFGRMAAHRSSGRWWPYMERLDWEEWPDRAAAQRKEAALIRRYRPKFNVIGNPDARRAK